MLTRIVISEMDRGDGQRVQTCIGKQGVVLQIYLVREFICILTYNMQNVAMNRFILGSLTLLNNPHCHSFDFSSAALLHSTSNLFSKSSSNMWPESKNRPQTPSWPVTTDQCRCALPQVRSCAHLGPSMWCKHNKHMMQSNPMTHSWFFTIREQPIKSTSDAFWLGVGAEGQLSAVFLNSPTGFSDKRFWMRSHNQTGSARAQKPPQFQKAT